MTRIEEVGFLPARIEIPHPFIPGLSSDGELQFGSKTTASTNVVKSLRPMPSVEISDVELRARIGFGHHASAHFTIAFDKDRFSDAEILTLTSLLETSYSSIFYLTHEAFTDRLQVFVIDRRATGLLGRAVHSHFSLDDRALYLARSHAHSIRSNVLALLVHAMRINRYARHYTQTEGWTLMEDAFSILLQHRLTSDEDIFPFYSVEPDVVAQHVLATRASLRPLSMLSKECGGGSCFEHVILGGAFFTFLADTYSDDRIVEFSKCTDPITDETYQSFFGATLADLESRWKAHIPASLMTLTLEERTKAVNHWENCFDLAD